jgi:hypothetical protein
MPPRERLQNYRRGFLSHSAALYDFDSYGRDPFLTDFQREQTAFINDEQFISVLANKVGFFVSMAPFPTHRPDTFGIINSGTFHPIPTTQTLRTDGSVSTGDASSADVTSRTTAASLADEAPSTDAASSIDDASRTSDTDAICSAVTAISPGSSNSLDGLGYVSNVDKTLPAETWVLDRLRSGQELILKPVHAAGGTGVTHCSYREGTCHVNGSPVCDTVLSEMLDGLTANVVMEFVEQSTVTRDLYPESTNTIRVLTLWDSERNAAFCPIAVQRIGTEHSAPVDNFGRAGISAQVDLETGELGTGVQLSPDGRVRRHDSHPETGAQITGTKIPGWSSILDDVIEIAERFSFVPYLGWDLVVTDPGECVMLEVNNCPGMKSLQAHGPLLTDERTREFYARHGVCSPG